MKKDKRQEEALRQDTAWEAHCEELVRRSLRLSGVLGTWTRRHEVEELTGAPEGVTLH